MAEPVNDSTNGLLRVIIALMLRGKDEQPKTLRQKVEVLDELGLKPSEIAKILGRTSAYVNKELVGIRKSKRS
jgi:hypothetical protein